ncbi:MAG: T9SS type A sorting domain-containing protein, partial [Saprospiraceae bacterium]|nr:T9SS type A sorting domain-containing protein [Saprospiraceae bacterium]
TYIYGGTQADDMDSLMIIDVTDPTSPQLDLIHITTDGYINFSYVIDTILYVGSRDSLFIMRLDESGRPEPIKSIFTGWISDCTIQSNIAFLSAQGHGVRVYDVSDPFDPVYLSQLSHFSCHTKLFNQYALTQCKNGGPIWVHDISDIENPEFISEVSFGDRLYETEIVGDYAILATGSGILILDVENPSSPVEVSRTWLRSPQSLELTGTLGFVANGYAGFAIIDFADIENPRILSEINTGGRVDDIKVEDGYAYLASWGDGVRIFDISDPSSPIETDSFMTDRNYELLVVQGSYLYAFERDFGIKVLDVSNKSDIQVTDSIEYTGRIATMLIHDTLLYFSRNGNCQVLDLTDPAHPVLHSLEMSCSGPIAMVIDGNTYYVAHQYGGLYLYDLSDPYAPDFIVRYHDNLRFSDVTISGDRIYLSELEAGLYILEYTGASTSLDHLQPSKTLAIRTWPNPVRDELYVAVNNMEKDVAYYNIYDLQGSILQQKKVSDNGDVQKLDLQRLPDGLYLLAVHTSHGFGVSTFVKHK